jgi:hypothetical protein
MAKDDRIDLKGITREIRAVAGKLRTARGRASTEERSHIDELVSRMKGLEEYASDICSRTYAIWPKKQPVQPPAKPKPGKPKPPATPRKPPRKKTR